MSSHENSFTPKKFSPSILKKCKGVIEELQEQLARVNNLNRHKDDAIDMLQQQKSYLMQQNREFENLTSELKKANAVLKNEIELLRRHEITQIEDLKRKQKKYEESNRNKLMQFQEILNVKDQKIQDLENLIAKLEQTLTTQQQNKRGLDKQWQGTLHEVQRKVDNMELELKIKSEQNKRLQEKFQNRKCQCQDTILEIKKVRQPVIKMNMDLQARYRELELAHSPNKFNVLSAPKTDRSHDLRNMTKSKSVSRQRITNTVYIGQDYKKQSFDRIMPKSHQLHFLNPQDYPQNTPKNRQVSLRRPFFMHQQLQKQVASTRLNIQQSYRQLNMKSKLDTDKVQRTLNELEKKLQNMVRRMQHTQTDSCVQS